MQVTLPQGKIFGMDGKSYLSTEEIARLLAKQGVIVTFEQAK